MNEYERLMVAALVEDELKTRLETVVLWAGEIIDYLRESPDETNSELPDMSEDGLNRRAHAGASMLAELVASITAAFDETSIGQSSALAERNEVERHKPA